MADPGALTSGLLEWGVAAAPLTGQERSGDLHLVREFPGGALVAVIDALGHGEAAESEARRAAALLEPIVPGPVDELIQRCHAALRGPRGVVMALAAFDAARGMMSWAAVGNIEGVLVRANPEGAPTFRALVPAGGIVGRETVSVFLQTVPLLPGDLLVLATDGVRREFAEAVDPEQPPAALAADLLARFGRGTDDALLLAARYCGPS